MKLPFISVVIPTLNEEKFLESTLKSIKNQDYKGKYEIIVSDGMSKDDTVRIAKKYADEVVICKRKGIAIGRNTGEKLARGELLLFIDADTVILPDALTKVAKMFRNKKIVGGTGSVLPLNPKMSNIFIYWSVSQLVKKTVQLKSPQIGGLFCAYRKDAFDKVNGFNESFDTFEDFDMSKRISKLGRIGFLEDIVAFSSTRRIDNWGNTSATKKYLSMYLRYIITGNGTPIKDYKPIR